MSKEKICKNCYFYRRHSNSLDNCGYCINANGNPKIRQLPETYSCSAFEKKTNPANIEELERKIIIIENRLNNIENFLEALWDDKSREV